MRSSRSAPLTGARLSTVAESVQSRIVRPTAYNPVGLGSVTSDRCSNDRNPINVRIPRAPDNASAANAFNRRPRHRVTGMDGLYITKYFVSMESQVDGQVITLT